MLEERSLLEFAKGLTEFFLGIHHDRAIPCYGFSEWFAGDQEEPDAFFAGLDGDFVAAVKEDE